jgi:hypothetical protein
MRRIEIDTRRSPGRWPGFRRKAAWLDNYKILSISYVLMEEIFFTDLMEWPRRESK